MNILVIEDSSLCNMGCELIIDWLALTLGFILMFKVLIFLIVCGIYLIYQRIRRSPQIHRNDELLLRNTIPIVTNTIEYKICLYRIDNIRFRYICITDIDIWRTPVVEINNSNDQIIPLIENEKLICYCDGSYSHRMGIGYAGFCASNGFRKTRFLSPDHPRNGSTATEVLAAFLAIQYALKQHYQALTIYTDNSKVEQILKRPKYNDYFKYPHVCRILDEYYREKGQNSIEVIRVRGHPTIDEQRQCSINYQFAKIDRIVRRKTRQYIRRSRINFQLNFNYYYWDQYIPYSNYMYTVFRYYI